MYILFFVCALWKGSPSSWEETNWSAMVPLNHRLKFNMSILPSTLQIGVMGERLDREMNLKDVWCYLVHSLQHRWHEEWMSWRSETELGIQGCILEFHRNLRFFLLETPASNEVAAPNVHRKFLGPLATAAAGTGAYAPQKVEVAKVKVGKKR